MHLEFFVSLGMWRGLDSSNCTLCLHCWLRHLPPCEKSQLLFYLQCSSFCEVTQKPHHHRLVTLKPPCMPALQLDSPFRISQFRIYAFSQLSIECIGVMHLCWTLVPSLLPLVKATAQQLFTQHEVIEVTWRCFRVQGGHEDFMQTLGHFVVLLSLLLLFSIYMYVYACGGVCVCAHVCPWRAQEWISSLVTYSPGARITGNWELSSVGAVNQT